MRSLLAVLLGISLSGAASADQYARWVEEEFPGDYEKVQNCMPVTVEWTSQSNDPVWAEFEHRQDGAVVMRTPFKGSQSRGGGDPQQEIVVVLVDVGGDGVVNEASIEGIRTESGPEVEADPVAAMMLHTAVAVAAHSDRCQP